MAANGDGQAIMTLIELAEYMRVHPSTITRLMRTRGLPGFRIARNWRFRKIRIDAWTQSKRVDRQVSK